MTSALALSWFPAALLAIGLALLLRSRLDSAKSSPARQRARDSAELEQMAQSCERHSPSMASELRSLAGRD